MSVSAHLRSLVEEHDRLESEISEAYSHYTDDVVVASLKKKKLAVSDKILQLKKKK